MSLNEPALLPSEGNPPMVPGDKWIRGVLDGHTIVDSRSFMFVWEIPYWPWWFFDRADIAGELVEPANPHALAAAPTGAIRYDLVCAGQVLEGAARGYPDSPHAGLKDLVAIEFSALDHWFEEDIEVFVHPRSPFTRVDALASSRHVVVSIDDVVLADSHKPTVLFETGAPARFYLPMTDVNLDLLISASRKSSCPYKGDARFWSAQIGGRVVDDIAWSYTLPRAESLPVAGMVCFYNEQVDIDIDGERQQRPTSHFA